MNKSNKFSPEVRERAVRMVQKHRGDYGPEFLDVLKLRAAPAAKGVLDAIEVLRTMNADNARAVPTDAPTAFIKPRWAKLVLSDARID